MSKNGKLKKAQNVEKRRLQLEEAMECVTLKQAAEAQPVTLFKPEPRKSLSLKHPDENGTAPVLRREPKQCSFEHCRRYVDSSCTVCPYCGHALHEPEASARHLTAP